MRRSFKSTLHNYRFSYHIPREIEPKNAAPLLCAGVTVFNALYSNNVSPTQSIGIVGIGGLGISFFQKIIILYVSYILFLGGVTTIQVILPYNSLTNGDAMLPLFLVILRKRKKHCLLELMSFSTRKILGHLVLLTTHPNLITFSILLLLIFTMMTTWVY